MGVDFDKEIDALLRRTRYDGPVLVGDLASPHLDADELAAFAENALPATARGAYTLHLADCDRCRKILSNLLVMNSEAAPAAAPSSVITIAERDLPWYRKLGLFPNLAYVMGGLILIFGGFLAFTVLQSGMGDRASEVTQVSEPQRGGPNFQDDATAFNDMTAANSANASANIATGSAPMMANANSAARTVEPGPAGPRAGENNNFLADGLALSEAAPPPAPPAPGAKPEAKELRESPEKDRDEEKKAATVPSIDAPKVEALAKQKADSNLPVQSGPMRQNESNYQRELENLNSRRAAAAGRSVSREDAEGDRREVGSRTFERKQGVWYDVNYQGRPTINVRRGTDKFQRLDAGLRSIANSLSGTIVVVWGAKAYRIQ